MRVKTSVKHLCLYLISTNSSIEILIWNHMKKRSGAGITYWHALYFKFLFSIFILCRYGEVDKLKKAICECEGGINKFTTAYKTFGIHINPDNSVRCKEWAPGARQLYLYGDFSKVYFDWIPVFVKTTYNLFTDGWDKKKNPYKKLEYGKWELVLPANPDGSCPIQHGSKVKVCKVHYNIL